MLRLEGREKDSKVRVGAKKKKQRNYLRQKKESKGKCPNADEACGTGCNE